MVVPTDRRHGGLLSSNEFMSDSVFRFQSPIRIPTHTTRKKVEERLILAFENLLEAL